MFRLIKVCDVRNAGRTVTRALVPLGAAFAAAACAAKSSPPTTTVAALRAEASRYSLGPLELRASSTVNAEETIRALRPEWLRANPTFRHGESPERAAVYVGNSYLGELDVLRLVQTAEISAIQYLTPMEARGRFGPSCQCGAGAILITRIENRVW